MQSSSNESDSDAYQTKLPSILDLPLSESASLMFQSIQKMNINELKQTESKGKKNGGSSHSKSSWSAQEDAVLLNAVSGKSNINWDHIASIDGRHTPKQCRERWLVKLNPEVRRSPFEPWEDELIQSERQKIGNHWSLIAQLLPGRTSCSVKNRWYTVLRYKQPLQFPMYPMNTFVLPMRPPVNRNVLC